MCHTRTPIYRISELLQTPSCVCWDMSWCALSGTGSLHQQWNICRHRGCHSGTATITAPSGSSHLLEVHWHRPHIILGLWIGLITPITGTAVLLWCKWHVKTNVHAGWGKWEAMKSNCKGNEMEWFAVILQRQVFLFTLLPDCKLVPAGGLWVSERPWLL